VSKRKLSILDHENHNNYSSNFRLWDEYWHSTHWGGLLKEYMHYREGSFQNFHLCGLGTRCPNVVKVYLIFEGVVFHVLTRGPKLDTHTCTYLAWLWVHCIGLFKSSMKIFFCFCFFFLQNTCRWSLANSNESLENIQYRNIVGNYAFLLWDL
jgi:hypothetical protein